MSTMAPTLRPLACWKSLLRCSRQQKAVSGSRSLVTTSYHRKTSAPLKPAYDPLNPTPHVNRKIRVYPPPPTPATNFKEPINDLHAAQIAILDPTGARTDLFSRSNPEAAHVGDILLVRLKSGDPFAGVCINIRRRGVDTGILLRNELTRVAVEMWYKIYSPNVEGIEVVQRAKKRARRARLTYMRKPKHDIGSVQNLVMHYQRSKNAARSGVTDVKTNSSSGKKKKKNKGKK
ncbi:ribosomal protein L19 [Phlyctema vagabunda]|uniref:Ribosomal protein L19 n=1 Tax=Phlyctema vagabunda TaxID=108571 RepID=A0ABR4PIB5_9HELO